MILIESQVIAVKAEVNVEPPVTIVVGYSSVGEGSLRLLFELKRVPLAHKRPVALVQEEKRPAAADDEQVLPSLVLKVGEERACRTVENSDARLLGDVFKRSVAAIAVEPIWQSGRLADVQVVKSVVVIIACGHSVVAINIDTAGAIEHRSPVVDAVH